MKTQSTKKNILKLIKLFYSIIYNKLSILINSFKTKILSTMNRVNRLPECDCTVNHNVFKISNLYIILRQFTTKLFQVCSKSKTR